MVLGLVLEKQRFNWDMSDRYVEVMKLLETSDEERIPVIKNKEWARLEGPVAHGNIYKRGKGKMQDHKCSQC